MDAIATTHLADRLDAALPQMQCRRCGYAGCRPYAEAIACGDAINRCPPGGDALIAALAAMTARPRVALDPAHGRARTADGRPHRRGALHRLHAVPGGLPGRCDRRRRQAHAHGAPGAVHRLRSVRRAVSRRLHRHHSRRPDLGRRRRATRARPLRRAARAGSQPSRPMRRIRPRVPMRRAGIDADRAFRQEAVAAALLRARARRAAGPGGRSPA